MDPNILGVGIFRKRRASMDPVDPPPPSKTPPPRMSPSKVPAPYDTPLADGRCALLELPDEVLVQVFSKLPLAGLTQSFRLCKRIHEVLADSAAVSLQVTLLANKLSINPNATRARPDLLAQRPLTSAEMLATLRDRLERFRTVSPASWSVVRLKEGEGSLYEYLEGVLLRTKDGRGRKSNELAVYDLRAADTSMAQKAGRGEADQTEEKKPAEEEEEECEIVDHDEALADADGWTDVESVAANELDVRREHRFRFPIYEVAVDPGQDLLILVEVQNSGRVVPPVDHPYANTSGRPIFTMYLHLFSLTTFEPHPLAAQPVLEFPFDLYAQSIHLDFQICDDALFVMYRRNRGMRDTLIGYQWTSGRVVVALEAASTQSFTSFVLLSPTSFVIPTVVQRIDATLGRIADITDLSDITFAYSLNVYSFPSFSGVPLEELPATAYTPVPVSVVQLPDFSYDLNRGIPPPMTTIRTDPPPRHQYATHPLHAPPPFRPDPESGIAVVEVHTGTDAHYVMILHKAALQQHVPERLPAKDAPVPVVPWESIAPSVRVFGPDVEEVSWVCYVYQNKYVTIWQDEDDEDVAQLLVYDFDPVNVRKERLDRLREFPNATDDELEGDRDGVELVLTETVITEPERIRHDIRAGGSLPYLLVRKPASDSNVALIDSERILTMTHDSATQTEEEMVEVWQM
ncbi:hypothetical protein Q8F55_003090 [Vanrija albida]|uniref:F-box domain-containing protein n=1 Tax=Vanrija albida TaxID=181172 RepID=A0ABR3QBL7_9TREE